MFFCSLMTFRNFQFDFKITHSKILKLPRTTFGLVVLQCDQIGQYFPTLAKVLIVSVQILFSISQNI